MTSRPNTKRACVMIVEAEIAFGMKLADWLAFQGYQAVLVRSVEAALDTFEDLHPNAVFIGLVRTEPTETIGLLTLRQLIDTVDLRIPVITMGTRTRKTFGQGLRYAEIRHRFDRSVALTQLNDMDGTPPGTENNNRLAHTMLRRWNSPMHLLPEQVANDVGLEGAEVA